jgi:hypothetical protein
MQKASGAEIKDLTGSARLSASNSSASVIRRRPRSPRNPARLRATCCAPASATALAGRAGCEFPKAFRVVAGLRAGNTPDRGYIAMQNGYTCVCHSRFQNEVIGGET